MQTGSFSLGGSVFRKGTPVLVQERCRHTAAGQPLHILLTLSLAGWKMLERELIALYYPLSDMHRAGARETFWCQGAQASRKERTQKRHSSLRRKVQSQAIWKRDMAAVYKPELSRRHIADMHQQATEPQVLACRSRDIRKDRVSPYTDRISISTLRCAAWHT